MVGQDRNLAGNAWQDRFTATGHAGKEMWFDEAFGNEEVRIDGSLIDQAFPAGRQRPDADHIIIIAADVDNEFFFFRNFFSVFGDQFFMGGRTMHPGCNQYGNINIRIAFAQFCQQLWHDDMARYRTRMVTGNDGARLFPLCQFTQAGTSNRIGQRICNKFFF